MANKVQWRGANEDAIRNFFQGSEYTPDFNRSIFGGRRLTIYGPLYTKNIPVNSWIQVEDDGYISVEKGTKWVANK